MPATSDHKRGRPKAAPPSALVARLIAAGRAAFPPDDAPTRRPAMRTIPVDVPRWAEAAGVDRSAIYRILSGRAVDPTVSVVDRLVRAAGATLTLPMEE